LSELVSKPTLSAVNRYRPSRLTRARRLVFGLTLFLLASPFSSTSSVAADRSLILATTTSVRDSGLLEMLLPDFEQKTGIEVRVIAVGTGAALRMGREGDVDLLLTHAPAAEMELIEDGVASRRTPFMENFFVIAGPAEDPAGVAEATSPGDAIHRIAKTRSRWVSRADDSGTHKKEMSLFRSAGLREDEEWEGLDRTGTGMGLSLQVAGEFRAYILSDIGTFLAFQKRIDLVPLSRAADSLRNVYSILQLDSARFDRPLATPAAEELERYLLDASTQSRIGQFGIERFGRPLFTPLHAGGEAIIPMPDRKMSD
jgi:tungstate transport system substrate-binding protein